MNCYNSHDGYLFYPSFDDDARVLDKFHELAADPEYEELSCKKVIEFV